MALYSKKIYDKRDGLKPCTVCKAKIANRHFFKHLHNCLEKYEDDLDAIGLIQCPLSNYHVIPKPYISDHLVRRCEEVKNKIRREFNSDEAMPAVNESEFREEWDPQNLLDEQARRYLLIFGIDIQGNSIDGQFRCGRQRFSEDDEDDHHPSSFAGNNPKHGSRKGRNEDSENEEVPKKRSKVHVDGLD